MGRFFCSTISRFVPPCTVANRENLEWPPKTQQESLKKHVKTFGWWNRNSLFLQPLKNDVPWCNRQHVWFWFRRVQVRALAGQQQSKALTRKNEGFFYLRSPQFANSYLPKPTRWFFFDQNAVLRRLEPLQGGSTIYLQTHIQLTTSNKNSAFHKIENKII